MSEHLKAGIKASAEQARRDGSTPNHSCPWQFGSPEGLHWMACYLCAGLVFKV